MSHATDLQFAENFAVRAGRFILESRKNAVTRTKTDGTPVTNIDEDVNGMFVSDVRAYDRGGNKTSIIGEEFSSEHTGATRKWIIDPIDGTKEYTRSMPDSKRTSCVAVALIERDVIQLSVVYNPFKGDLFVASRRGGFARLNGRALRVDSRMAFSPRLTYDYAHWNGAVINTPALKTAMDKPPLNFGSAIWQACEVARGKSAFTAFPGNKIHDIAPGALIVEMAGGVVTDARGGDALSLNGAVYAASSAIHEEVVRLIA